MNREKLNSLVRRPAADGRRKNRKLIRQGIIDFRGRRCGQFRQWCCCVAGMAILLSTGAESAAQDKDKSAAEVEKTAEGPARPRVANPFPDASAVPAGILDGGGEWLNTSGPIDLKDLRGKVVLLDFWTYCCINCIHVLPDLKYLEKKYEKELVVIGVHSAKFANEKLSENIRDAILRYEIKHPVVNDNEMVIWNRFRTRAWPTLSLIDPEGKFIGSQGGEGNRELFDSVIGRLVEYHRANGTLDETPIVFDLEQNRAATTPLRYPGKILADAASGRLFVSDSNHNRIVVADLDGNLLYTIGSGNMGRADGDFEKAEFDHPQGMELVGNTLYIADTENHLIRAADLDTKSVTTLAGTGQQGRPREVDGGLATTNLNSPWDLCHIDGTLFIAMAGPHQIWSHRLGSRKIKVYAGNSREDVINGSLAASSFAQPSGLTANGDGTVFFVADSEGSSIRSVPVDPDGRVTTIAGTSELPRGQSLFAFGDVDGIGADARLQHPLGVAWHDGNMYVADSYNHKIRKIDLASGAVSTWLGNGQAGDALSPPQLNEPAGLSVAGEFLYIADTNNHRICKVNLTSQEFTVLEIKGLTPPSPRKPKRVPDLKEALSPGDQTVKLSDAATVLVDLAVPTGFKLNSLAPVTWEVFQIDGDQILAPEVLESRAEAKVEDRSGTFRISLSGNPGTATVAIEMSYGYCESDTTGVCRLARAVWSFPLTVLEDSEAEEIRLMFPPQVTVSGN